MSDKSIGTARTIRTRARGLGAAMALGGALIALTATSPGEAALRNRGRSALSSNAAQLQLVAPAPQMTQTASPQLTIQPPPPPQQPPADALDTDTYNLGRDIVRRVIYVHVKEIKHCYQQALLKQPQLAGRLVVNFHIDPQGQVHNLFIQESTLAAPELLGCISEVMQSWSYPPTPYYAGLTQIIYPFVLRPKIPEPPPGIEVSDAELESLGVYKDPEPPAVDIIF